MSDLLEIRVGASAYRHIKQHGLRTSDIRYIFGASGAAKWLAIYGLDRAIFGEWLKDIKHPVQLYGTSVGAFKLAAACRKDPADSLDLLAKAYVEQSYPDQNFSADRISAETTSILNSVVGGAGIEEILKNPVFHFHCGAVRTTGALAKNQSNRQKLALAMIFIDAFGERKNYGKRLERIIFHHPKYPDTFSGADKVTTNMAALNETNFANALLASGSIPSLMHGVSDIDNAPAGNYFDGGVLDYHPLPEYLGANDGITLYPHFYSHLIPGWFDKNFKGRYAKSHQLENVVMLSPSPEMLAQLPSGKIPDRKDFLTFKHDDEERRRRWGQCMDLSKALGEEFLETVSQEKIVDQLIPFD